ncbi:MAG: M1 family aminopeptidase, partial [Rhodothermales bacterium]|nr:M1 family aminopeptidase [Rhodothermales bacterium]
LDPAPQAGARRTFTVRYGGVPADGLIISTNKHGDRTFFGDNWPNRARHWLPAVDHPSDKARVEFAVTAPAHYQVVGSGRLAEETDLGDGLRLTRWRTDAPLATKVAVIGAARFAVEYVDEVAGASVESWVYPQDRDAGFFDYALAEPVLLYFVSRLGAFPYEKLANVQSRTRYGGMENASNIFYSENSVTGERRAEGLIAHEVAHQWFGNAVTEADWPHVWLSEGFATYLTALYLEHTYGRERLAAEMAQDRGQIIAFHARTPLPVVWEETPQNLLQLLNPNSYQKGGFVLHMLRYRLGTEVFWDGLRAYYARYRDGNATTEDFMHVMEDVSGQDLDAFFDQWLRRAGHPVFEGTWSYDAAAQHLTVALRQTQDGPAFAVPLEIGIYTDEALLPRIVVADVDEKAETFTFDLELAGAPARVVLDPHVWMLMEADFGPR